ncbi:MAG: AmmeMemoRadiSam system protein B [Pseudomonadota bacterium]
MSSIRPAAVAGTFYPSDPDELRGMLALYLQDAGSDSAIPRAMILPHAGYIYSGPVAASGYASLLADKAAFQRVVLLGPAHQVAFTGIAAPTATTFMTPLGPVAVDQEAINRLMTFPQVTLLDEAHRLEHSLEVHLPFLQVTLEAFTLVPLVVGDSDAESVCEVIEALASDPGTLIIVSSDLSHYHDYDTAVRLDAATTGKIESLDFKTIGYDHACGRNPVNGLLLYAQRHGMHANTLDLRNSGDTAGPRDQVVGYGAYAFS